MVARGGTCCACRGHAQGAQGKGVGLLGACRATGTGAGAPLGGHDRRGGRGPRGRGTAAGWEEPAGEGYDHRGRARDAEGGASHRGRALREPPGDAREEERGHAGREEGREREREKERGRERESSPWGSKSGDNRHRIT
jgi:hypothetical protein